MVRFIGTDTASVELLFNMFTSGIETFIIPCEQLLYPSDVEVCRLRFTVALISASLSFWKRWRWPNRNFLSCDGNHWARGPGYRVLTVEPCVAIDLAQLTMYFDRRDALCIQKLYHRPHFTVGGCWNKSFHLQPLQLCYCKVPLVYVSCDIITLSRTLSLFTQ